jgi:hypothetical protein
VPRPGTSLVVGEMSKDYETLKEALLELYLSVKIRSDEEVK